MKAHDNIQTFAELVKPWTLILLAAHVILGLGLFAAVLFAIWNSLQVGIKIGVTSVVLYIGLQHTYQWIRTHIQHGLHSYDAELGQLK